MADDIVAGAGRLKAWLIDEALPMWGGVGFDAAQASFVERLDVSGAPLLDAPRRAMVQARQVYVFAQAALAGWRPQGQSLALAAADNLIARYHATDAAPGWIFSADAAGRPHDTRRDLYAYAFVLFGLAWAWRLAPKRRYLEAARATLADLDRRFAVIGGGYHSALPADVNELRQNPHMHLFEALLSWFAATGEADFLARADRLRDLMVTRFVQPSGILCERFDGAWRPLAGEAGRICEPGHHCEWAWLLAQHARLAGVVSDSLAATLAVRAMRHGVGADGLLVDELRDDGHVVRASRRVWPQTEAIKAHAAAFEAGDVATAAGAARLIGRLFDVFLDRPVRGGWIDHVDAEGAPLVSFMPASTLYHLMGAAVEADRVWGRQRLRPAALLDRDGVLNVDHGYVHRIETLELMLGAARAVRRLNEAGYLVIVASNQSGIARGYYTLDDAHRFNAALRERLAEEGARIDAFYLAPYHPDGVVEPYARPHDDRKPGPGMLRRALAEWPVDAARSFLIGDKDSDLEAAQRAGLPGHLYRGGDLDVFVRDVLAQPG
ncbi:MAG: HAD-IIIA family hydrolase [Xanthobacteraceae bacterium]